ncbi:MAG: MBL fold metallo-hydrolase [Chitinophagaceae bacterium]|nr:MBL fold metallo-hydrolase [Chitinophagaceae bacterium]MBP6478775.1 MBL fold metallo-hydrolase [Chitinophagaceae bacterium]MBP7109049.1 MBL fold metallo-hydrolase [Chitinophagaceae bacterium]MBP7315697.1 MBL fold metallo-hydrolase [Chitinophagaceae bacterium]HQX97418.1 MBL fold metallo-hydrolase [Chitinophagaceae bacterium]
MKIAFHGAARTVTGSKHLITLRNGKKILLDCGMFQGMGKATIPLNNDLGFDASTVDVMVLSHAHIDHSGLIPKLVKEGFRGKIYCTPATKDLTGILLEDSAHIQENEVRYVNKKRAAEGQPYVQPLYTLDDAKKATERLTEVKYNEWKTIEQGVELFFTDAGHIIGSACVHLRITDNGKTESLTFSGDIGRYRDIILRSPDVFPQADYIIMESTYGNSLHEMQFTTPNHLLEWVERTCIQKKGKLIIPAFSVGRTQEILFALNQLELENRLPKVDYFLDSPLSIEATDIIKRYPNYFNKTIQKVLEKDDDPFKFPGLKYIQTVDQSKMLNFRNEPCVIISASGMAEAGRVKHHISNNVENSRNAILMTGYCEPRSLGARLQTGAKEVGIFGVEHEVNAEIGSIRSMSAHGDYEDMSQWLACQNPREVKRLFLVHGEYDVQQDFKSRLIKKGFVDVEIPEMHYETGLS